MMLMGIRATPDGTVEGVVVNTSGSSLAGMREQIGCDRVDLVRLHDRIDGWVDDDGLYTQEPNRVGSLLAHALGRPLGSSLLYGPVLFLSVDADGATRSLSPEQYEQIMTAAADAKARLTAAEAAIAAMSL